MLQTTKILDRSFNRYSPRDGMFDRQECDQERRICVVPMGISPVSIWPESFQSAELIVLYGADMTPGSNPSDYIKAHVEFARAYLHPYLDETDLRNAESRPPIEILPHPEWKGSDDRFIDSEDPRLHVRVSRIRPTAHFNARVFKIETPEQALDFIAERMGLPSLDCQN